MSQDKRTGPPPGGRPDNHTEAQSTAPPAYPRGDDPARRTWLPVVNGRRRASRDLDRLLADPVLKTGCACACRCGAPVAEVDYEPLSWSVRQRQVRGEVGGRWTA